MNHSNHFFFAVRIPEETKIIMWNHIEKIKEVLPFSRWVNHQDLHITLAFLGAAPPEKREDAEKNVKEAIVDSKALTLGINRLGFFGSEDSPRVFWADTEESKQLQLIRKRCLQRAGRPDFN